MNESFVKEMLNRVKNFTDDMEKLGVSVVDVHAEGVVIKIKLNLKTPEKNSTEGGDADKTKTDTQS